MTMLQWLRVWHTFFTAQAPWKPTPRTGRKPRKVPKLVELLEQRTLLSAAFAKPSLAVGPEIEVHQQPIGPAVLMHDINQKAVTPDLDSGKHGRPDNHFSSGQALGNRSDNDKGSREVTELLDDWNNGGKSWNLMGPQAANWEVPADNGLVQSFPRQIDEDTSDHGENQKMTDPSTNRTDLLPRRVDAGTNGRSENTIDIDSDPLADPAHSLREQVQAARHDTAISDSDPPTHFLAADSGTIRTDPPSTAQGQPAANNASDPPASVSRNAATVSAPGSRFVTPTITNRRFNLSSESSESAPANDNSNPQPPADQQESSSPSLADTGLPTAALASSLATIFPVATVPLAALQTLAAPPFRAVDELILARLIRKPGSGAAPDVSQLVDEERLFLELLNDHDVIPFFEDLKPNNMPYLLLPQMQDLSIPEIPKIDAMPLPETPKPDEPSAPREDQPGREGMLGTLALPVLLAFRNWDRQERKAASTGSHVRGQETRAQH